MKLPINEDVTQRIVVSGGAYERADDPRMVKIPKRNFQTKVTFEQLTTGRRR